MKLDREDVICIIVAMLCVIGIAICVNIGKVYFDDPKSEKTILVDDNRITLEGIKWL